jgi:hypothetical protein
MREVRKAVRSGKVLAVIIAPNIEVRRLGRGVPRERVMEGVAGANGGERHAAEGALWFLRGAPAAALPSFAPPSDPQAQRAGAQAMAYAPEDAPTPNAGWPDPRP